MSRWTWLKVRLLIQTSNGAVTFKYLQSGQMTATKPRKHRFVAKLRTSRTSPVVIQVVLVSTARAQVREKSKTGPRSSKAKNVRRFFHSQHLSAKPKMIDPQPNKRTKSNFQRPCPSLRSMTKQPRFRRSTNYLRKTQS